MSTKIRGLPPRVALRIKDSATGSYPSIARTGDDSRRGKYGINYNDTSTINFIEITDVDSSGSTKRDAPFDLRFAHGRYSSQDNLIAYYRFKGAFSTSGSDTILTDLGNSGSLHLTSSFAGDMFVSGGFSSGSAGAGTFVDNQEGQFFSQADSAVVEGTSASFAFGDGSADYQRSLSCWLIKDSVIPATNSIFFSASGSINGGTDHYEFGVLGTDILGGRIFARFFDDSADENIALVIDSFNSGTIHYNKWFHLAFTYDGSGTSDGMKFYINGEYALPSVVVDSVSYVAMEEFGTAPIIGASGNVSKPKVNPWRGLVDNFALFDKVLSPLEIKELAGFRKGISFPVGLGANSGFLAESERTDIFAAGTIRKGISENFISFTPGENISPFNESFRPEQSQSDDFYLTGTDARGSALGFSSCLASKTQIKLEFNVDSLTTMNSSTASLVYYNCNTKTFDLAGGAESLIPVSFHDATAMLGRDCKLFGPFGTPLMSGTAGTLNRPSPFHGESSPSEALDKSLVYVQDRSATLNQRFVASEDQAISLSGILSAPFLLEKAVIEIPISSSDGWFNDRTTVIQDIGGAFESDAGGPCVTVGLLNQLSDIHRDIVLSASIIPIGDTGSFAHTAPTSIRMPAGFESFSTPNAIIPESGPAIATAKAKATISNSVYMLGAAISDFGSSKIAEINPFGRSLHPRKPSARSYFGKEFSIGALSDDATTYSEDIETIGNVFSYEKHEVSPYLLFPEDKLILCVAKHRPVLAAPSDRTILTGSHEFGLNVGTIKVVLYGSLIRNNQEFHDTLNQNLTSDSVHEAIHYDNPVVDQFDIEPKDALYMSYVDGYFTGSMFAEKDSGDNGFTDGRRGRRISIVEKDFFNDPAEEGSYEVDILPYSGSITFAKFLKSPGFSRNIALISEEERYFDTLLPRFDKIAQANGADLVKETVAASGSNIIHIPLGRKFLSTYGFNFDAKWDFAYPFEPSYSTIERSTNPLKHLIAKKNKNNASIGDFESSEIAILREENSRNYKTAPFDPLSTNADYWYFIDSTPSLTVVTPKSKPPADVALALFGIGDGQYGEPLFEEMGAGTNFATRVNVRGFKYGVFNARKENSKCIFRRDRYGQFRDMLEQRRDSKFFLESNSSVIEGPVQIRFIGVSGSITGGEETLSNNVSIESTSSLPYFDGIGRSRGPLPSVELVP